MNIELKHSLSFIDELQYKTTPEQMEQSKFFGVLLKEMGRNQLLKVIIFLSEQVELLKNDNSNYLNL